ncbi:hypothetical protein DTO217A2_1650 [Paecilomyces variotii]|nr:hypothetical protein DTO217A2_1650 [Paecilomyces variotii]KAJ9390534.1 hypothetical protein DTO063F5_1484 [Paecilomyces variotii]
MTATLADPYRDYQIDYSTHEHCKAEEQQGLLVYQTTQPQVLHHGARADVPFPSGSAHHSVFQQHHQHGTPTALPHAGSHPIAQDIHQPVLLTSHQMVSPQMQSHYGSAPLHVPFSAPRGTKRTRPEDDGEGDHDDRHLGLHLPMLPPEAHTEGAHPSELLLSSHDDSSSHRRTSLHAFVPPPPPPALLHHQQHHHHRLPSQVISHQSQHQGTDMTSPSLPSGPPSVVGQAGMPDPAPRPRGPKLKFTPEEDALLVELKENKNLTWKQIADFFPGRTSGTLQVRYCTKLKAKDTVWTDDMVHRLRNAIQEYENDRWRLIAAKVGNGFTPAACREKATEL